MRVCLCEGEGAIVCGSVLGCYFKFIFKIGPSSEVYGTCHVEGWIFFATQFCFLLFLWFSLLTCHYCHYFMFGCCCYYYFYCQYYLFNITGKIIITWTHKIIDRFAIYIAYSIMLVLELLPELFYAFSLFHILHLPFGCMHQFLKYSGESFCCGLVWDKPDHKLL